MATEYERDQAFMEGHRNAAAESYFSARSDLMTTPSQIARFDAGFSRGWDAGRAPLLERIASLEAENHNLNWALGTEGFDQMATPEEQAEHENGHAEVMANIDRMKARKERHDQLVPDGVDYLDLIEALTAQVAQAAQPAGWQKAILRSEEDGMVVIGWDYCTEAEFGHLRIPKRKLYTSPPKAVPLTDEQQEVKK